MKTAMKLVIVLLSSLLLFANCQPKPTPPAAKYTLATRIDSLFADFDHLETPGYAIGISKDGTTLYKTGYGATNLDYQLPIHSQSAFSIASVSKQFTAACIALLILEDALSLETDVAEFVPELRKYNDTIRVKHLVYNTSGITDYMRLKRKSGQSWVTFNYFEIDECIATSLAQDSLRFKPGEKWDYCNVNFMLLTKIVKQVSGQSFADFAQARLFQPLGMEHTFIHDDITRIVPNRVTPYNPRTEEYVQGYKEYGIQLRSEGTYIQHHRNAPHYGGSGVVTTIDDLLKWSANMTTKAFGGQAIYDLMNHTPKFNHDRDNQAFGLYMSDFKGRKTTAWEGGDWGISSQLLRFPDQGITIVVLSNLGSGAASRKANEMAAVLIAEGIIQ
ncbi:MAG: serine hydrolase domain-containing protein [Salibacteraceae bacterium]